MNKKVVILASVLITIISIVIYIIKQPNNMISDKGSTTLQKKRSGLLDILVKDESVNVYSKKDPVSSTTNLNKEKSQPLNKTVDCNKQTELFDFCSKPNTFINECQAETYRDNDSYSKDLIQCIKVKYNSTDEKEYNEARKTLILRDPKYGDHKSQWYIPPYIKNIDCQNQERQNLFCQAPNKYIDACISTRDGSFSDAYDGYSRKLQDCIKNNFMLIGYDKESKDNYEEARQKLILEDSKYGNPLSQFYVPPYVQGIDCGKQDELFCQNPEGYIDVCLPITFVDRKSYYSNKMKECVTTSYPTSASQEVKDKLKVSYNNAKNKLLKLYPDIKILDFPTVSCELESQLFCDMPDEYIESCFYTKLPRESSDKQIKNEARVYAEKVNNCLSSEHLINNKEDFKKAKKLLLEKDPTLIISDPPSKPCKQENISNMFCQFPDEYIEGCKVVNSNTDEYYIEKLRSCLKDSKLVLNKDSYKKALSLLPNNNLPLELPSVDCKNEEQGSYFCQDIKSYIEGCRTVNNNDDEDYVNKLYNCLQTEKHRMKPEDYSEGLKLLNQTLIKEKGLPLQLPTVDCFKPDDNDMLCRKPNEYVKQCKMYNDYPARIDYCLTNKKHLMSKDKYEEAVKELNYPTSLPNEFPTVDCKNKTELSMFCSTPNKYIKDCLNFTSPTPIEMMNNCLINDYDRLNPETYKEAIKLLNNPPSLPQELPTVKCSVKDDLNMFCRKPNEYINQCKPYDKERFSGLLRTCLFTYKHILTSDSYKEALKSLDNPKNFPTDVPSVDCSTQETQNEFCKSPDKFINSCKNLTNKDDDWYISNINNCLLFNVDKMNNVSYEEALKILNNPSSLPTKLPSVNCGDETLFCKAPGEYIEGCLNITNPIDKLKTCLRDDEIINSESYKKAVNLLNKPSSLPSELSNIKCSLKQEEGAFCSKPDEYIKTCSPFGSPDEIQMLKKCLNGDSFDKLTPSSYKEAVSLLNNPQSLPSSLPTVKCNTKNDINMFCSKPDEYIKSCDNFIAPSPEEMIRRCLTEETSILKEENYKEAIKLLNNPSSLPSSLPTVKCSTLNEQNSFCSKPNEYIKYCSPIIQPNAEERLKDCLLNKKDLLQISNYNEALNLLPNNILPLEIPSVDCKNENSLFCDNMSSYIKDCKTLNSNTDETYVNKIYTCLINERYKIKPSDYSEGVTMLNQTLVRNKKLPLELPTVDCFKPDENDMLCRKPDEYVKQCNNDIDYVSKLTNCLNTKKHLMSKDKYEEAVKELPLPKKFPVGDCSKKQDLNMFCKNPDQYIDCPNFTAPDPKDMLSNCFTTNLQDLQSNITGYTNALLTLGNPSNLPSTLPEGNCNDKKNKNMFCKNPDKYIDCPSFTSPTPTELLQSCTVTNLNDLKNNIDGYNKARLKLGSSLPSTLPTVDCDRKQDLNMFCKNPDQYLDCPNFTAPDPKQMLGNCFITNLSDLQTNISGYQEARKKLQISSLPEVLPEGDCNFKTNLNYFCKMPDKLIGCPNFNPEDTLKKCFDSNVSELNSNVQGYDNARKILNSSLPEKLPGNNCNLKGELNAFCYSPDKYVTCPDFTNATELLGTCVNSRLNTLKSNPESYKQALKLLGNPPSLPQYLPQGNCLYSRQYNYFCREPDKYIGCPGLDSNWMLNQCNEIYPERYNTDPYIKARSMLQPSQHLKFSNFNNLMRSMRIQI